MPMGQTMSAARKFAGYRITLTSHFTLLFRQFKQFNRDLIRAFQERRPQPVADGWLGRYTFHWRAPV